MEQNLRQLQNLEEAAEDIGLVQVITFQQGNDPKYTVRALMKRIGSTYIFVLH